MRRSIGITLGAALWLLAAPAQAIQLHWANGSTNITFSQNTRAILVVQADSAEVTLPSQWTLDWLSDSLGVNVVAVDSATACQLDTAKVSSIDPPATPADSAAHQITAHFCSGGNSPATTAYFVLDQPGGSKGKLKVVAIDPTDPDSSRVIESGEVTYNGGVDGSYAPTLLSASLSRSSDVITVAAVGTGLSAITAARIVGPESSWSVTLTPVASDDHSVTSVAEVPAALPSASLEVSDVRGALALAPLSGDPPSEPEFTSYTYGSYVSPSSAWRPKDFTFFWDNLSPGKFHLFYMRTATGGTSDSVERIIAHVSGTDLYHWTSTPELTLPTYSTPPAGQTHRWDEAKVWAPSLIQSGATYYLFYTGVNNLGDQNIGVASTSNINASQISWTRHDVALFTDSKFSGTGLSFASPTVCRDPFVWEDPYAPGHFHMWFNGVTTGGVQAIAIAHTIGTDLTNWQVDGALPIVAQVPELSSKTESPHAFSHTNAAGDTAYYLLSTGNDSAVPREDRLLRDRASAWDNLADTGASHWNLLSSLYDQLNFSLYDQYIFGGWEATEYCKFFRHEYIAGINATTHPPDPTTYAIWITMIQWTAGTGGAADQMSLLGPVTAVDGKNAVQVPTANGLRLTSGNPSHGVLAFEVALKSQQQSTLDVFDASGRRVRNLESSVMSAGRHEVSWDGRDEAGSAAHSGIYFVRLRHSTGSSTVRVVVMH